MELFGPASQNVVLTGLGSRSPQVSLAVVLDEVCQDILKASYRGVSVTELRVHPAVYEAVAGIRSKEVARGSRLMLLGLNLVSKAGIPVDHPEIG